MIKANVNFKFKVPNFDFSKELKFIAERIIIPDIAGHIQQGDSIEGVRYPPLADITIKIKGHANPLIGEERRLFSSSTYHTIGQGKNKLIIRIKAIRAEIGKFLQIDGVKSKQYGKRYFKFFGVSKEAEREAIGFMAGKIKVLTSGK